MCKNKNHKKVKLLERHMQRASQLQLLTGWPWSSWWRQKATLNSHVVVSSHHRFQDVCYMYFWLARDAKMWKFLLVVLWVNPWNTYAYEWCMNTLYVTTSTRNFQKLHKHTPITAVFEDLAIEGVMHGTLAQIQTVKNFFSVGTSGVWDHLILKIHPCRQ